MADAFASSRLVAAPRGDGTAGQFISTGFGSGPVSVQKDFDYERAVLRGFDVNPIAFACMDRTALMVAAIPWTYEEMVKGKWQPIPDADELAVFRRPNARIPLLNLHWFGTEALMGGGNFLLKKVMIGKRVDEFWPMNLVKAEPRVQNNNWTVGYRVWENSRRIFVPAEKVIHVMRGMNTLKPFWGRSPMMSAMSTVEMSNEHIKWNRNLANNLMVPPGAFVSGQVLNKAQTKEAQAILTEGFAGPENARKFLVLSGGAKWEQMGMTPKEIDWMASQRFSLVLTCAALGHMSVMFSDASLTFNNLGTATKYGWTHSATPILNILRSAYNHDADLIPLKQLGKRRYNYDLSGEDATIQGMTDRIKSHELAVRAGVNLSDSIEAHHLPLPIRPEYDRSYVPRSMNRADIEEAAPPPDAPGQ